MFALMLIQILILEEIINSYAKHRMVFNDTDQVVIMNIRLDTPPIQYAPGGARAY